jgi:hypothetical protein
MRAAIFTSLALAAIASASQAQVLVSDDFSTAGLVTNTGWVNHSGSGDFINSDGNTALLSQGGGSREDVHLSFAVPQAGTDTTYAAFDLNIPAGGVVDPDANGLYFFHFWTAGFAYRARIGVLSPAGSGDYVLSVNANSSNGGAGAQWASDLSFGTTYRVVTSFDAVTGTASLWLDPANSGSTSIVHVGTSLGEGMEGIAMRQGGDYVGLMNLDNVIAGLSFGDVTGGGGPTAPGSAYCFGDATGALCPCSAFGAAGEGCVNTGGTGATLTGSGIALFANDTLQFDVAGVPGAKPGLLLRANNQIANPVGDGILCVAGNSQRSQVQLTSAGATTYTNFNGAGFGATANVGAPTNYQFWYRDTSNPCSGSGFNFTNAWTVTYM